MKSGEFCVRGALDIFCFVHYLQSMPETRQFITDDAGNKTSVVLPIAEYEELMEDLADLACVAERRDEESVPFEDVVAKLKEDGLVSRDD